RVRHAQVDEPESVVLREPAAGEVLDVRPQVDARDALRPTPLDRALERRAVRGLPGERRDPAAEELRIPVEDAAGHHAPASGRAPPAYGGRSPARQWLRPSYSPRPPRPNSWAPENLATIQARKVKPRPAPPPIRHRPTRPGRTTPPKNVNAKPP